MDGLKNVLIRDMAVYHPETMRDNQYYVDYFKEKWIPEEETLHIQEEVLGRKNRFVIDKNSSENSFTMAVKASKAVLEKANLTGADIDMVCFCSLSPEYNVPPVATLVYQSIGGKETGICYDMNANCIGMALAYEQIVRYMSANPAIDRVLLVESEYLTYLSNPEDVLFYSTFGDSAFAMILERTSEKYGLLLSDFKFKMPKKELARGPRCGFSHLLNLNPIEMRTHLQGVKIDYYDMKKNIISMLNSAKLKMHDLKAICIWQFSIKIRNEIAKVLNVDESIVPYIGDKYGYTGCTSPFLALYHEVQSGRVKHGDYVLIWTVGYEVQEIYILLRF